MCALRKNKQDSFHRVLQIRSYFCFSNKIHVTFSSRMLGTLICHFYCRSWIYIAVTKMHLNCVCEMNKKRERKRKQI